jgi:hypothetical protein
MPFGQIQIGGYQIIKKWLSYRKFDLLIAALILLQPELDKNYQMVKAATVAL